MRVADLIEAIDDPSGLIHPEKHQAFARGTHPLARHPAYPAHQPQAGDRTTNYEEVLASRQWQKILQKANQYLGVPLTKQSLPAIQSKLLQSMGVIDQAESQHAEELEALAIELVFELPEFRSARKSYETGRVQIDAKITGEAGEMGDDMATSDEQPPENDEVAMAAQQRTPAEQDWMKKMVQRRHFTNAMIQGSAVSNDFLFELAGRRLDQIDPRLRKAYGIMMISTEIGYWMFPQDMIIAGAREKTHVGSSAIETASAQDEPENELPAPGEEEQPPTRNVPRIKARGACFPVLIQEIIKGLTEVASLASLPRDPIERKEVIRQADMVDLEAWSMILGPKLWDSFVEAIDAENERELTMHLYRHIQAMDVDQFNAFMKEVLAKSPRGVKMLRDLAAQIKAELAEDETMDGPVEEARKIVDHLINEDEEFGNDDDDFREVATTTPGVRGKWSQPYYGTRAHVIEDAVRRFGMQGTEIGPSDKNNRGWMAVTIEFTEGCGQSPMTAYFISEEDAESWLEYLYRLNKSERPSSPF